MAKKEQNEADKVGVSMDLNGELHTKINKVQSFISFTQGKRLTKPEIMHILMNDGYKAWEKRIREYAAA